MNTNPNSPTHPRKRRTARPSPPSPASPPSHSSPPTGCAGNVVHSYRTFQSALDRGASCSELYDQRARFDDEDTLAKIDRDLDRIGCTSPDATRND